MVVFQYYRKARQKACQLAYPDMEDDDDEATGRSMNYPRPFSEPPSPSVSRHTTPASSRHGSDDEDDEVDEEKEVSMLLFIKSSCLGSISQTCNELPLK